MHYEFGLKYSSIDQVDLTMHTLGNDCAYGYIGEYLSRNPAESVFDLEDTPTDFILFQLDQD